MSDLEQLKQLVDELERALSRALATAAQEPVLRSGKLAWIQPGELASQMRPGS